MLLAVLLACSPKTVVPGANLPDPSGPAAPVWPALLEVDAAMAELMRSEPVPGASAAIVRDGEVVWAGAYGTKDTRTDAPVTLETPFLVASISKTLTAVSLLQVHETGAFALDAPVSDALAFPLTHAARPDVPITYRHLFQHRSGIVDDWDVLEAYTVPGDSDVPLATFLEDYLAPGGAEYSPMNFGTAAPGERFEYSNIGAATLGLLVEAHTGLSFDTHTRAGIFEPLGMAHTGWFVADFAEDELAAPHVRRLGSLRPIPHFGVPDYPDGMLRTTATDLGRFLGAVAASDPVLLERPTRDAMLGLGSDPDGLIWFGMQLAGRDVVGHDGSERGTTAEMYFEPASGVGVILLMNGEVGSYAPVDGVLEAMFEHAPASPPR